MRSQTQIKIHEPRPLPVAPLEAVRAAWLSRRFKASPAVARIVAELVLQTGASR